MSDNKKTYAKPLYGSVHVYDYEHRGDSARAYSILNRYGITDTSFQNNGDGNVAFIEFTMEFTDIRRCQRLTDDMEKAGYGVGFVNLYEYVGKDFRKMVTDLNILPISERDIKDFVEAVPFGSETDAMDDWTCLAEWKEYRTTLSREPMALTTILNFLKNKMGATEVGYSETSMEITIRANVPFSKVKEYKRALLDKEWVSKTLLLFWRTSRDWRDDSYDLYSLYYMMNNTERYKNTSRFKAHQHALGGW